MTKPTTPVSSVLDTLKHTALYTIDLIETGQDQISGALTVDDVESGQDVLDATRRFLLTALAEHIDGINPDGLWVSEQFTEAAYRAVHTYDDGSPVTVTRDLGDGSIQVWYPRITQPIPVRTCLRAVSEPVGNDGLTDREREEYARRYREGAGRKCLSLAERLAAAGWLRAKREPTA